MVQSRQAPTTKVTGTPNLYRQVDLATSASYVNYDLGMVAGEDGGDSLFFIHLYDNDVALEYELLEGVDQDGPWDVVDSGAIAISVDPATPTLTKSGVFYGGVLRLAVRHSAGAGTFSLKMLSK